MDIRKTVSAGAKLGRTDALALLSEVSRVIIAKGRKVNTYDKREADVDMQACLEQMLGSTGNLRAPTVKKGRTLLVGFNEKEYRATFGVE